MGEVTRGGGRGRPHLLVLLLEARREGFRVLPVVGNRGGGPRTVVLAAVVGGVVLSVVVGRVLLRGNLN